MQASHELPLTGRGQGSMTLDPATFDTLYAAQADRLYSSCYRILRDEQQAQDAVQEAWLRAFSRGDDAPIDNPGAWLITVARNAALDQYRRRKHLAPLAEEAGEDEASAPQLVEDDPYGDPAKAVPAGDQKHLALALIDDLRPDQGRLLELHYVDGVPIAELAAIIGKSANATTVALHRARAALRARYVDHVFARAALPEACRARKAELVAAASGGSRSTDLAAHLETCSPCQESVAELRSMSAPWAVAPLLFAPPALKVSVTAALAAQHAAAGAGAATAAGLTGSSAASAGSSGTIATATSAGAAHAGIMAALVGVGVISVAAGALLFGQPASAHRYADTFVEIGSMGAPHGRGTATVMADGAVLIADGGINVRGPGLELYRPDSQTFEAVSKAPMYNRDRQTATRLLDGTVLFAGGTNNILSLGWATVSVYDPATNKAHNVKPMLTARIGHTATLLLDGRVLITGGVAWLHNRNQTLASAEIYDPATGSFTPTGDMTSPRQGHTATRLTDGTVLITGGKGKLVLSSAEVYDPATGSFHAVGAMSIARQGHTATLLEDNSVLIAGGTDGKSYTASAERYDAVSGAFSPVGPMAAPRARQGAVLLADGTVLLVGGAASGPKNPPVDTAEIFDPVAGTFSSIGPMHSPRQWPLVTLLNDGSVLVTGGLDSNGLLATAELFQ